MRHWHGIARRDATLLFGLAGIAIACAGYSSVARGQAGAPTHATDAQTGDDLTEVIVTAQHRAERQVDVPLSVAVQTGDQLAQAGIIDTRDLTMVTPGLKVDRLGLYTQTAIRGISSGVVDPGTEANIAYYVDGVYQPSQLALTFDLLDIDHIEVDKGPQGTLFGRNATGGAIQFFTRKPSFTPGGTLSAGYGRFNSQDYKASFTGPIIGQTLAGSISGSYNTNDGYFIDLTRSGARFPHLSSVMLRGKLLWQPADNTTVLATYQHINRQDPGGVLGNALNGNTLARVLVPGVIIATKPYEVAWGPRQPYSHWTSTIASLKADFDLGYGVLSSITGYTRDDVKGTVEGDFTPAAIAEYSLHIPSTYYSEELQFAAQKSHGLSWVGGLFFFEGKGSWNPLYVPEASFYVYGTQKDRSMAAFGEAHYDITSRLTGILGLRYSHERKELDGSFGVPPGVPLVDEKTKLGEKSWNSVNPRASLRYQLTESSNAYFTYTQGFKSGGYVVSTLFKEPYDPEKVDAFEIGLKTSQTSFNFNTALFYYKYRDQQVNTTVNRNGVPLGLVANAASSRIYGWDADVMAVLSHEFKLNAAIEILSAKYISYPKAEVNAPATVDPFGRPCTLCGNQSVIADLSGNHLLRAPDWTLSVSPTYTKRFSAGELELTATVYHTAQFSFEPLNRIRQPAYTSINARAGWEFGSSGFRIAAWGRNLTNRVIYSGAFQTVLADGIQYAPPRTYGAEVSYTF